MVPSTFALHSISYIAFTKFVPPSIRSLLHSLLLPNGPSYILSSLHKPYGPFCITICAACRLFKIRTLRAPNPTRRIRRFVFSSMWPNVTASSESYVKLFCVMWTQMNLVAGIDCCWCWYSAALNFKNFMLLGHRRCHHVTFDQPNWPHYITMIHDREQKLWAINVSWRVVARWYSLPLVFFW